MAITLRTSYMYYDRVIISNTKSPTLGDIYYRWHLRSAVNCCKEDRSGKLIFIDADHNNKIIVCPVQS